MNITLDTRLTEDTHQLGSFNDCLLLLSKNALFPWFILVPATDEIEFHKVNTKQQITIQQYINAVAQFIEGYFATDKINIASIGNIVSQLHIHVIGRHQGDACWPNVVWGTTEFKSYNKEDISAIKAQLNNTLNGIFHVTTPS